MPSDMALFSAVSHDANPLHMSPAYARRTPFGEPIVFGVLGALATMQHTPPRPDQVLSKVSLLFLEPLFERVRYSVTVKSDAAEDSIQVLDGRRRMVECTFTYQDGATHPGAADSATARWPMAGSVASRTAPTEWNEASITDGLSVTGDYMPPSSEMERLISRWELEDKGITPQQIAALAWTSYVVGMEIPGKQAAYSRLEMSLTADQPAETDPYSYFVEVVRRDSRFDLLHLAARLRLGKTVVADAKISAFLRSNSPMCSLDSLQRCLPPSRALHGKVALVIGGSRGLGAALAAALASQGCSVLINYSRSQHEAEALRDNLIGAQWDVRLLAGDAADYDWCQRQGDNVAAEFGGLDFLVCNASPAIRPLDFVPDTLERFHDFVERSLRLVATPLAAFQEPLKLRHGRPIVISSIYAKTAPADFPHYVAAKSAIEGLMQSVSTRGAASGMLVRPPKLLTDQTNTPLGKKGAAMPEEVAAKVVAQLLAESAPKGVQILEDFEIAE